ncbi:MiaB/RimO family radical SAM methylthiotransferase [Leptospira levettii]|uniref:Ribosomal protein uS12 methylthiotransferase RimO n=1 Tax=Leptospira levettii TaxID=2023178 RepID=A0ABY2MIA3_9LEPT|nr:MiaB/RimO family radical SAM methylthiotransferase [Leptospira levettii]MCW7472707.1 MiaB/RimO family radical SAM methylthiotransferase [Leptospira levettii]PJZ37447.1 30S ribosomal protein S12 methylthiotransferase RimO [Leptospira levettii]PJZ88847.1 30S ribosomal protein S12 methylthiotransferase RimO [Leptospira levettii]PKA00462.1 30S ribosomal protein S12 methylthiotransferase RimO [Leptospira levettii]TGK97974.1 MiaB/RimO family radical SAM methylthiotransferase [Leptospira levettii]
MPKSKDQTEETPKSFFITTLGCPKNTVDSMAMHQSLLKEGLLPAADPEASDFHLVNTCTFIQDATKETIQTILDSIDIKKKNKQKLVVVGCFAERAGKEISADLPEVDLHFGTGKYDKAGEILRSHFPLDFKDLTEFNEDLLERLKTSKGIENYSKPYSYVKISDGCNRGCHFCIIPNLRGKYRDTEITDVLEQTRLAVKAGSKEICLVSQDTVFYGKDTDKLMDLVRSVAAVDGLEILRLLYLYPDKKTEKLLDLYREIPKIAPYLESPLQHVSKSVLKSMNRTGDYEFFKSLFQKARDIRPDLEIRTSFILGFPGETMEDVEEIIRFVEDVKPEKVNLFPYSPQDGTKGATMEGQLKDKEIARRVNLVREAYLGTLKTIHQNRIGKIYPCVVDEVLDEGAIVRRLQDAPEIDEVVYVDASNLKVGQYGKVRVDSFYELDMSGTWVE